MSYHGKQTPEFHLVTATQKCYPYWLPNKTLGFRQGGCTYSVCNTAKFPDWFNSQNQVFSLVKTMSLISQSLHDLSQQEFNHIYSLHIYTCHTPHIFVEEPPSMHYLRYSMKRKRNPKTRACPSYRIVSQLNEFCTIPSQTFTTYNSLSICLGIPLTSLKGIKEVAIFLLQKV